MITFDGKNRKHRRSLQREVNQAERKKLLAVGDEFEFIVVRHQEQSYADIYNRFLEAYVNTSKGFNKRARRTEVDTYWFRNKYKNNWRLRLRRWWNGILQRARLTPLPA